MTQTPPKYIINPLLIPTTWTGPEWGLRAFRNPNWLHSAWLGTVWNLACLPERIWGNAIKPLLRGEVLIALGSLVALALLTPLMMVMGLLGQVTMLPFELDVLSEAYILDLEEAQQDLKSGEGAGIRVLSTS